LPVIVLTALTRLPDIIGSATDSITVTEQNGVYDLTGIADTDETAVILPPGYTYYPNILLTPETADSAVSTEITFPDILWRRIQLFS